MKLPAHRQLTRLQYMTNQRQHPVFEAASAHMNAPCLN
jgi:hypothetical protein